MKLRKLLSAIVAAVLVIGLFPSIGIEKAYATSDTVSSWSELVEKYGSEDGYT